MRESSLNYMRKRVAGRVKRDPSLWESELVSHRLVQLKVQKGNIALYRNHMAFVIWLTRVLLALVIKNLNLSP